MSVSLDRNVDSLFSTSLEPLLLECPPLKREPFETDGAGFCRTDALLVAQTMHQITEV